MQYILAVVRPPCAIALPRLHNRIRAARGSPEEAFVVETAPCNTNYPRDVSKGYSCHSHKDSIGLIYLSHLIQLPVLLPVSANSHLTSNIKSTHN